MSAGSDQEVRVAGVILVAGWSGVWITTALAPGEVVRGGPALAGPAPRRIPAPLQRSRSHGALTLPGGRASLAALPMGAETARRVVVEAPAKVNLALEVLGKRADGYHEIVTVLQAVDLCDRIDLVEADTMELRVTAPGVPADATNLAVRAARALDEAAGGGRGVRITLHKRIPVAAGLGGGSSDAAGVLLGLNRLWRLRWPVARLAEVAVTLGMDVPFFLGSGLALGTGRGERLERLRGRGLALVLVNPRRTASTAEVYRRVTPSMYSDGERTREAARAVGQGGPAAVAARLYNVLEKVATDPATGPMQAALLAAGALGTAVSGSGPTVFGIARSYEHARQIRTRLTRATWSCWAVRSRGGPAVRVRAA